MKHPPHSLTCSVHLSQLLAMGPVDADGLAVIPRTALGPVCMRCIRQHLHKARAAYADPATSQWPVLSWSAVRSSRGILCTICGHNLPMAEPGVPEPEPWDLRIKPATRHELLRALHSLILVKPMFLCPAADALGVDIWPVLLEDFGRRGPLNSLLYQADILTMPPELTSVAYMQRKSPADGILAHQQLRLAYLKARLTMPDKLGLL